MNDHSQRIIEIMHEKKMNATQFSEAIGIQRAAMSHITLGRNNPSADVITKIIDRFDDINPGWLLTGKGIMKIANEHQDSKTEEQQSFRSLPQETEKMKKLFQEDDDAIYKHQAPISYRSDIQAESRQQDKINQPETFNQAENSNKTTEKEVFMYRETTVRTIEKLVIFYSDQTYETFIQEKRDCERT